MKIDSSTHIPFKLNRSLQEMFTRFLNFFTQFASHASRFKIWRPATKLEQTSWRGCDILTQMPK